MTPSEALSEQSRQAGLTAFVLQPNGSVAGWGNNNHGQTSPPAGLSGVIAIAPGGGLGGFSLGLRSDGTVVGWPALCRQGGLR